MADAVVPGGFEGSGACEFTEVAQPAVDTESRAKSTSSSRDSLPGVGAALRKHRLAKGLSLRQFARQLEVSASFISQLENGKSQPSVATLFAICEALDVSVDQLFAQSSDRAHQRPNSDVFGDRRSGPAAHSGTGDSRGEGDRQDLAASGPVVRGGDRLRLVLDTGVTWEQLSSPDAPGEFLMITYEPGGGSTAESQLSRHSGTDYGLVINGQLTISLGFETFVMNATDSISFDSSIPHRLHNAGNEPAQAIWFVSNREVAGSQCALLDGRGNTKNSKM